jgi:hypothetical protein
LLAIVRDDEVCRRLMTTPGVGPVVALTYRVTVMQRRKFIVLLGGTAATWPLVTQAQQPAMPVIGLLHPRSRGDAAGSVAAFKRGLEETGFVEGKNLTTEYGGTHHRHVSAGRDDRKRKRLQARIRYYVREGVGAMIVTGSTFFLFSRARLTALAARHKIPAIYELREYVEAGGLMSYGASNEDAWTRSAFIGRV